MEPKNNGSSAENVYLEHRQDYTVSQKNLPNIETVWLEIIWVDFDGSWQKYSKDSTVEFACSSFHVCLLVITLSSLKLHTKNNVCMLCISVSC